jgi:hypothetical protein
VGAALTTPGRISIARWCGSGKRDEEGYARNQREYVLRKVNRLQPGGYGPGVVRTCFVPAGRELPGRLVDVGPGGHGEVLRDNHGDATGTELGSSFIERTSVNVGTVSILARLRRVQRGGSGWVHRRPRVETGRSRRSTPSQGKPVHMGKGGSSFEKQRRL